MKDARRFLRLAVAASLALAAPTWADDESDAEFVKKAANAGMLEVELGRHVAKNAANADVRAYGERMVADHSAANRELENVARRSGLAVPAELDKEHLEMKQRMTALRGADLDRAYMSAMVKDHRHVVKEFEEQAEQGKTEVDRWAARTLPTLQVHLAQAETVADRIEGETSGATSREGDHPSEALPAGPDPKRVPDRP